MDYFFGSIVIATCLWVFAVFRGRKAVRAYMYLRFLDHGESSSQANAAVICMGFLEAGKHQANARQFVYMQFDGKQLAMIASARSLGFKG
jgi:hypothetical protein